MRQEINFAKTVINSLPNADLGKRDYYVDNNRKSSHLKGFGLVVNDKGLKHFLLTQYFKRDKQTVRLRCGEYPRVTIEKARINAEELQQKLMAGIHPTEERSEAATARLQGLENTRIRSITLRAVLQDYLKHRRLKDSTKADYEKVIGEVWKDRLDEPLLSINDDLVKDRYRKRLKTSVARANYNMRVLRAIFNFARVEYKLPDGSVIFERNPVNVLSEGKTWHTVERRKRRIKAHELPSWMAAVNSLENPVSSAYLKFLLFTGARRGEAARLLSSDVNFKANCFTLRDTKNGSDVTLPMSSFVRNVLREVIVNGEKWVFRSPVTQSYIKDPRKAIQSVVDKSGVEFSLHDLRRTFISTAESLDISFYAIKALVNHKSGANTDVTEGYLDIADDSERLLKASQRITNMLQARIDTEVTAKVLEFK